MDRIRRHCASLHMCQAQQHMRMYIQCHYSSSHFTLLQQHSTGCHGSHTTSMSYNGCTSSSSGSSLWVVACASALLLGPSNPCMCQSNLSPRCCRQALLSGHQPPPLFPSAPPTNSRPPPLTVFRACLVVFVFCGWQAAVSGGPEQGATRPGQLPPSHCQHRQRALHMGCPAAARRAGNFQRFPTP